MNETIDEHPEPAHSDATALVATGRHASRRHLPQTFHSLRNRNYRLFWFGQLFSIAGFWMQMVAQAWLVLELTQSPLALGTVTALQYMPILLLALFAGVLIDRVPKRRLLIVTQTLAMLQSLALAVLVSTGSIELWHVYLLAIVLGMVNAFDHPARQAFVVEMVGREDIVNAVALNSTLMNAGRIIGPGLGGVIIARFGLAECFYANAFSFLAVIAGLFMMRSSLLHVSQHLPKGAVLEQLFDGLSFARRTPQVLVVVILISSLGTFGYNFTTAFPLLARNVLEVGAEGLGALFSAMGVGAVVAALAIATSRRTTHRSLFLAAVFFVLFEAALAASNVYAVSLLLIAFLGLASTAFTATANALLQLNTPDALRGRILSLYTMLLMGVTPIGSALTGLLSDRWGIQITLAIEAGICALGLLVALGYASTVRKR